MKTSITDRIFEVLKQREVKDSQLSRTLGVSRTTVSEWRNGKASPSAKIVLKFLHHFPEIDCNWLIRGTEKKQSGTTYGINMGNLVNETQNDYKLEVKHLRDLLKEKEEQIHLLKKMLDLQKE